MTDQRCTIGLDIGTTSLKAVAYLADGTQVLEHSTLIDTMNDEIGAATQDPEAIYQAVMASLQSAVTEATESGLDIAAIGFSAAMHSLIAISETNTPLSPAMTWLDSRPRNEAQELWQGDLGKDIYRHTGTPIHAMSPLAKITWLRNACPDVFGKTKHFSSIKEYIWFRWFGQWEIDVAMAGATGLFAIGDGRWYAPALAYAGIREQQLSTIVPTTFVRRPTPGSPLFDIGIQEDIAVCIGASDGVLANLAAGATEPGTMVLTVGTSLAMRIGTHQPAVDVDTRSFCYMLDEHHYIVGAPSNSGGVVLDWLYRNVFTQSGENFGTRFPELCELAGGVEIRELLCIPYVAGERAPIWNESAAASLIGLQVHHNQSHIMRAAIEGILFNAYTIGIRLMHQLGKPNRLIVSGKLFQQAWVQQFTADLFGLGVYGQEDVDGATLGAAMLANTALQLPPIPAQKTRDEIVRPRTAETGQLRERYQRYATMCDTLLK